MKWEWKEKRCSVLLCPTQLDINACKKPAWQKPWYPYRYHASSWSTEVGTKSSCVKTQTSLYKHFDALHLQKNTNKPGFYSKEVEKSNFRQYYGEMEKQRWEESGKRRKEVRRSEKRKSEKKEDAGARKGRKVAIHYVFPMICGSGGSISNLAKAAGAEPAGQMRDEQLHAVVARSTFPSQKCQKPMVSDHFWKLRCRKSARHCGAKHISKPKVSKTNGLRPLLEVAMSKKCAPLWREAHFQVKSVKNWGGSDHFLTRPL